MEAVELKQYTMKDLLRSLLCRTLSPSVFQSIRFRYWLLSSYSARLVGSGFLKRTPLIRSFGAALSSPRLENRLRNVNLSAPTRMCRVMTRWGSDKARTHKYTAVYSALFKEWRNRPLSILELGLGSNNLDTPSNMGPFGVPGASLRGWRELFPHALIYGADVDRGILFQEDRIKTFYCDQLDRSSIRELWSHPDLQNGADIIIEDGLHTFEANVSFLEESLDHIRPGGIYVAEDVDWNCISDWYDRLETIYSKQYPTYEFAFVTLANRGYNNLLVARRGAG